MLIKKKKSHLDKLMHKNKGGRGFWSSTEVWYQMKNAKVAETSGKSTRASQMKQAQVELRLWTSLRTHSVDMVCRQRVTNVEWGNDEVCLSELGSPNRGTGLLMSTSDPLGGPVHSKANSKAAFKKKQAAYLLCDPGQVPSPQSL